MIYLKEGQIPLNFAYNDEIIQEGNSKYQLSFKFPTNNPLWEELVEETLLLADDLHGEQEFIIFEVEKHHAYITVYANQVATLLNNYSITELSVNNASGDRVMRSLVSSIIREHKFTFSSNIANTHSLNLKNVTVANALFKDKHSIIGQWGGDLIRDKYDIRLLSNGGTNKEALFMYKKNLKSYQQKKSIKDLRTRIHFTKTINSQKEGEKDKVIAVTVDSPLISKYKNIYEGNLDVSDQDVTDEATLRKYGEQYFKTTLCDVIEENIEISVLGTPDEPVQIFDTVTIFYEKYNLDVKKKITKYTYAPMGRKLKTIGFGKIQSNLGTTLATMVDNAIEEKAETMLDAFKLQKNLAQLLKLDRKGIEDKLVELEEKSKGALEVKKALFEADGTIPDVVKAKILDAVEGDIGRLKTIITEAELIKAIQAKLNFAEIKNALIDKAFINQIISDEKFTQQFEEGQVTTQNIFTKLKDSIKSNISKEFVTKDGVRKLVNDLTIDADGIRQITQQESSKVFETKKSQLQGINSYIHKKYSDYPDGRNMSDNSNLKYIGIYTGNKQQAPTNASEYSWTKIRGEDGAKGRDGVDGKSINRNYIIDSDKLTNINSGGTNWEKTVENGTLVFTKVRATESTGIWTQIMPILKDNFQNEVLTWSVDVKASKNISFNNVGQETNGFKGRVDITTQWQRISHTFTNRYTQHYAFVFYQMIGTCSPGDKVYVRLPKLEKGNVATEWSPAYEDLRGRDGVSNYIHRKYSDSSNGANMDDNSNRKYIGIYTGTSPIPPTTASSYLWSKIKGEDGANGVPGAKGVDGRTPYFHTAYANSPTGDRDFSTTNSNDKLYIGTYSDFEVADSTDYRKYKWVKIKGENGRDGNNGRDGVSSYIYRKYSDNANGSPMSDNSNLKYIGIYTGTSATAPTTPSAYTWSKIKGEDGQQGVPGARGSDGRTSYLHTAYANSATGEHDFSTTNSNGKEYIGTYTDFEINDSNDYRRYKWVKIKGENGRNGTDGHTLTANLRLEGGYLNNVTNDVKAYLDVFYDGQKITDGFNARVKFKGGILNAWSNFWDAKVDNTGFLTNVSWGNKEQPYPIALELIALVTYKNLNTVANARLDNVPDVRLINETVKKYKTFESTLDGFTSVVGEIDTKVFSKSYFKNNLNSEDAEKTGNDLYFNTKENLQANEFYTILADLDNVPANQQAYIYSASDGGDKKTIQNGLNYWVVKYTTNQTRINLYPLGTNTKVKNVRIYKGDFRVKKDDERENLYSSSATDSGDKFIHLNLIKNKINGNVYTVKFDASGFSNGDRWDIYNRIGYNQENLTQVFKTKDNEFTFTINDNTTDDRIYIRMIQVGNTKISNVEIYDVTLGYAKNKEVSKLESSIKQTKDEIDLKVSKDEVIASINASVEKNEQGQNQGIVKIRGEVLADNIHGKTFTGSKFEVGKSGFLDSQGNNLRISAPHDWNGSSGVGMQLRGKTEGEFNQGLNIYRVNDVRNPNTPLYTPDETALTVFGEIRGAFKINSRPKSGSLKSRMGVAVMTNVSYNNPTYADGYAGGLYPVRSIYLKSGGGPTQLWVNDGTGSNSTYGVNVANMESDIKLKENITISNHSGLDVINKFTFHSFDWKADKFGYSKPHTKIGLIAQEVQEIQEDLVYKNPNALALDEFRLLNISLKAIQELSTENQQLKSQLNEMNERLTKLEDKINGNL